MIGDLYTRLQDARQKIEESKKKLNNIITEAHSDNQEIKVKANANKILTSIEISDDYLKSATSTELEELLIGTINKALKDAAQKGELEMKNITKDVLPNFPGWV